MSEPQSTLLVEGSFRELAEELADYIDNLSKSSVRTELTPLLEAVTTAEESNDSDEIESARDAVLEVIVKNCNALNSAPEKEYIAAWNLLIHLVKQSSDANEYLNPLCQSLSTAEISTSPSNRFGLALSVLSTIFNVLNPDDRIRFFVFNAILDVISKSSSYDVLQPQLKNLDHWMLSWKVPPQVQRRLYQRISSIAKDGGEEDEAYEYQIKALRTFASSDVNGEEAKQSSVTAVKMALSSSSRFDFEDLTPLDPVQGLRSSASALYQLLQIFTSDSLEDYVNFKDENKGFIETEGFDDDVLTRKIRLLTLTSLAAASGQARSLPYKTIADSLQIPAEDVEMWVIDVIRAGLVEGKLSQLKQTFLIHRSTYRVFTENQWREVAGRLDMWKASLASVLEVVRQEKQNFLQQKEMDLKAADAKVNSFEDRPHGGRRGGRNNQRGGRQDQNHSHQQEPIEVE